MADILIDVKVVGTQDVLKVQTAMAKVEREAKKLSASMNQGRLTSQAYFKGQTQLVAVLTKAGVGYKEAQRAVFGYTKALKDSTIASGQMARSVGQSTQVATKGTSRLGVVAQQTGYQVGDFLVQIQSGANPIMAFGQQATQLAGVMSLFGGKLLFAGAALGILIPLATAIGGAWWASSKAAKEASREVDVHADSLKRTNSELASFLSLLERIKRGQSSNVAVLTKEFENLSVKIAAAQESLSKIDPEGPLALGAESIAKNIILLKNQQLDIAKKLTAEQERQEFEAAQSLLIMQDKAVLMLAEKELGRESSEYLAIQASLQKQAYEEEVRRMDVSQNIKEQLIATNRVIVDARLELDQAALASEKAADELERANASAGSLAGIDFSNIANGATWAGALADQLARARGAAADKAVGGNVDFFDPRGGPLSGRILKDRPVPKENRPGYVPPKIRGSSGGGGGSKGSSDPLGDLVKRIELDTKLLGVSESRAEVMRKLGDDASKYNQEEIEAVVKRLDVYSQEKEALELVQSTQQSIADTLKSSMSEAFMSMVDGTKSFKDAMKDMAKSVIKQLFDILVVQRLVGSFDSKSGKGTGIVGAFMSAFQADGGAWSGGRQIQAYADGGVIGGPTMFPMSGGKTGLMGEAGPEAIMPLKRGKNGKLGVETSGSGSVVVNNNFSISANGDDSVKRIIQSQMPKISEATKRAVVDSKRRGGSYGRSF